MFSVSLLFAVAQAAAPSAFECTSAKGYTFDVRVISGSKVAISDAAHSMEKPYHVSDNLMVVELEESDPKWNPPSIYIDFKDWNYAVYPDGDPAGDMPPPVQEGTCRPK